MSVPLFSVQAISDANAGRPRPPSEGGPQPSWLLAPWVAPVWLLDVPNPSVRDIEKRVLWDAPAEGMTLALTDAGCEDLLETCRQFLWVLSFEGLNVDGAKVSTVLTKSQKLLPMVRWMLENGFTSFGTMDDDAIVSLMAWVAQRPGKKKDTKINRRTREQFYQVLRELHQFAIDGLIPDGIRSDPKTLTRQLIAKVGDMPGHSRNSTPRIPEPLAQHLLASAILWIEEVAPYLRRAIDAVEPWSPSPWDEKVERLRTFVDANTPPAALGMSIGSVHDLVRSARLLMSASLVVIAAFTGFRISEILSIMIDRVRDRYDGPAVVTKILKTSEMLEGAATERPIPDIVAQAIAVATWISAEYRPDGVTKLFLFPGQNGEPCIGGDATWINRINSFARHVGVPMPASDRDAWWFTPHQFRRFFALFYVRRFQGSLDALRHHFRHITEEMVWHYAQDPDTARFLAEERTDFTVRMMSLIATGEIAAVGLAAMQLKELGAVYRASVMPPAEIEKAIRRKIKAEKIELRASGYGFCFRSPARATQAACGVAADGLPNAAGRTTKACLGCANGCFTKNEEPALRIEYIVHKEVADDPSGGMVIRNAAREHMVQIADRLTELEK